MDTFQLTDDLNPLYRRGYCWPKEPSVLINENYWYDTRAFVKAGNIGPDHKCYLVCSSCHKPREVRENVRNVDYFKAYRFQLPLIQNHFPMLSAAERELILSGICGQCYDNMFVEVDYDD